MKQKAKKNPKNSLIFILYNIMVVAVIIGLSELTIQYFLNNPKSIPPYMIKPFRGYYSLHIRKAIQMEKNCAKYDLELFYTLKPGTCNFSNVEFNSSYSINSLGLRDDELSLNNPEIILLGDSFTMGWGVEQDSTFEKLLENKTQKRTLNAGISSYGTIRELTLLKKRIQIKNLKYLIIQYHDSDLAENIEFRKNGDSLVISSKKIYEDNVDLVQKRTKYFFGKHSALLLKFITKRVLGKEDNRRITGAEDAHTFMYILKSVDLPDDIQIIVFELSSYGEVGNKFIDHLAELVKQDKKLNVIPIKIQQYLNSNDYFILDDHINERGHKKVADVLAKTLESL